MLPRMKRPATLLTVLLLLAGPAPAQDLPQGATARLGDPTFLHDARIVSVAWAGERLITTGSTSAALWDRGGRRIGHLDLSKGMASRFLCVSPDATLVADSSGDEKVAVWSLVTGEQLVEVTCPDIHQVTAVAFAPDGRTVAVGGGTDVLWLDVEQRAIVARTKVSEGGVHGLAFDPRGRWLAVKAIYEPGVVLLDVEGRRVAKTLKVEGLKHASFSRDGATLCVVEGGQVSLWDVAKGERRVESGSHGAVCAEMGPDGHVFSATNSGVVCCLDGTTLVERWRGKDPGMLASLAVSPDGKHVATGGCDSRARVRETAGGRLVNTDASEMSWVPALDFSPDGERLAWVGADVQVWDLAPARLVRRFATTPGPKGVVHRSTEELVVIEGTYRGLVRLASLRDGTAREVLRVQDPFRAVAGAPGAPIVALAAYDGTGVTVLSLADGASTTLPLRGPSALAITAAGDRLVVAGEGLIGWDLAAQKAGWTVAHRYDAVAVAPDGARVAASTLFTKRLDLLDGSTGERRATLECPDGGVGALVFSVDGTQLAGRTTTSILVWRREGEAWTLAQRFVPGPAGAAAVAFSPDGKTLASGGFDGLVTLWRLNGP